MKTINKLLIGAGALVWLALGVRDCKGSEVPKGYKNYRMHLHSQDIITSPTGRPIVRRWYDVDNDGLKDCGEGYLVMGITKEGVIISRNPGSYWFDYNLDNEVQNDELYEDRLMDGWNGNEKLYKQPKIKLEDLKEGTKL